MAGNSYSDLIEKTLRLLTPTQVEQQIKVTANYTAAGGTLTVDSTSPSYAAAGRPGTILASGPGVPLQLWYVVSDAGSGVLNVIGGFQGSTDTSFNFSGTTTVVVRPKFSRYDVAVAINDELLSLSGPDNGLGQILTADITYVPVFMGYSLPATFDANSSKVLEVSFSEPQPTRRRPLIRRNQYRVIRHASATDTDFPNGCGIVVYKPGWPGFPIHVQFLAPFSSLSLTSLSQNVLTVAGVPVEAQDIVSMGAALRLAPNREIQRNTMGAQPDPRKATEVPPGGIRGAVDGNTGLMAQYQRRISQEYARLIRAYPEHEGW